MDGRRIKKTDFFFSKYLFYKEKDILLIMARIDLGYIDIKNFEESLADLKNSSETVIDNKNIQVYIDYPVSNPKIVNIAAPNGNNFTKIDLIRSICEFYHKMYQEERDTSTLKEEKACERNPNCRLMNRAYTDGIWGIWGHDIDDLMLHTISKDKDVWFLGIDS